MPIRSQAEPNAYEELRGRVRTLTREIEHYQQDAKEARRNAEAAQEQVDRLSALKEQYKAIIEPYEEKLVKPGEVIVSGININTNAEWLIKRAEQVRRDALAMGGI